MTEEKFETIDSAEEEEPIYYSPKRLGLVSVIASVLSWFVLVGFLADISAQGVSIASQLKTQGLVLSNVLKESSFISYILTTLVTPFLTGLVFFTVLQAASIGLNVLLEMDSNVRETESEQMA